VLQNQLTFVRKLFQ